MKHIRVAFAAFLLLALTVVGLINIRSTANADSGTAARAPLTGTWELVSFEARAGDTVSYPFGQDAQGLLTINQDRYMSVAVWKAQRTNFAVPDWQRGTPEEYTAAMKSYIQYMGEVTVDVQAKTLTTEVVTSALPNWHGTRQLRHYRLFDGGKKLELTTPPVLFGGQTVVGALVWQRVES